MSINIFTNFKTSFKTIFTSIILTFCFSITFGQSLPVPQQVLTEKRVRETLKENAETIRFMENKGQYPNKDVLYYCESKKGSIYIEKSKIRFVTSEYVTKKKGKKINENDSTVLREDQSVLVGRHIFTINLNGSNENPTLNLGASFRTNYNYILGNDPNSWFSGITAAKDLTLEDVYPGIDLRLYSTKDGSLEFDWIIDPGADYSKISMGFEGQDKLKINKDGSLKVGLRFTDLEFHIPESYQVTDHGKVAVDFEFTKTNSNTIAFKTKSIIDPSFPVVIDPTLVWGSYMDDIVSAPNDFDEYLYAIQLDTLDGILYCAGATNRQITTGTSPYDANGYQNVVTGLTGGTNTGEATSVVYRINSTGNDLLDLTLYGPATIPNNGTVNAFGLSLSQNRVFISGMTELDIPRVGSPFDNVQNGTDAFVAVFSKDLGTLHYATFLGSTGAETQGATCIRAISDTSFIVGMTANGTLPRTSPNYFPVQAADTTYGGAGDMYIAKFSGLNNLVWGTYVGGAQADEFNDLEILTDGRVAFCGNGASTLTEFNSAAGRSVVITNLDGIIGVLNSTGTTFNYLDEIGGAGNDRIQDCEVIGSKLYFTGDVATGFPTSSGAYDVSFNGGGTDAIIGAVDAAGTTGYIATFYGTSSNDLGNGIKQVTQSDCGGDSTTTFLLIWGTVGGTGLPTINPSGEPFYDASHNGGTDMFFAGFPNALNTLLYGTYVGGSDNDYLGNIGDPRGSNQLNVYGSNIYVGTTIHSSSHTPNAIFGGFDGTKSNGTDDSHIIFQLELPSIVQTDYGDIPLQWGKPSHTIDCENLYIGNLDGELDIQPNLQANGDDLAGIDDEDGVLTLGSLAAGGPQDISITIDNIHNSTGQTANLYGWINLEGTVRFQANEFVSTTVADGFTGSKTLTWTGVTISGPDSNRFLRIRLTTNNLQDDVSTTAFDERSFLSASNGEVEDYLLGSFYLSCPLDTTLGTCLSQTLVDSFYTAWLAKGVGGGGCNGVLSNNSTGAPSACGGAKTVVFTYISDCPLDTLTCSAVFTVSTPTAVAITCPANQSEIACQTQAAINSKFATWLALASKSGGCNAVLSNNNSGAPNACGGTTTVTFTVTSSCEANKTCTASFGVAAPAAIVLTCPINVTEVACQTQASINTKYAAWLATATKSGGCSSTLTNNSPGNPAACGATVTVTFTVTSTCEATKTCTASFTVTSSPVVLTCPVNQVEAACQTQTDINTKYATWLASVSTSGGCSASLTNNSTGAPDACLGGTKTVTFTVTSTCEANKTCSATFAVTAATPVVLTCPTNVTEAACQTQATINSKFTIWLASATKSGGCNAILSNNNTGAPNSCTGGTVTVTFTVTSSCEANKTCSATFGVTAATPVALICPSNQSEVACQTQAAIDSKFTTWLASAVFAGGCSAAISNNNTGAPNACTGGTVTVTFTVTSTCEANKTCSATFGVAAATPVALLCPTNQSEAACQTQGAIDTKFASWLASAVFAGGCSAAISNNNTGAPNACTGGTVTVTFTVTSSCESNKTCSATFGVTGTPLIVLTCPTNVTEVKCQSQAAIDTKYANWLATAGFTGGCSAVLTNNSPGTPSACGATNTVTFTVTSTCEPNKTCSAIFAVTSPTPVVINCPTNVIEAECQTQAAIDTKFATWLATASFTGGCNAAMINDNTGAPLACGGSKTVTFTVVSTCEPTKTCSAVFTVLDAPVVTLTCPINQTEAACQTQAAINTKFATWLASAAFTNSCNAGISNNNSGAPAACGGTTTVTFTVTSTCEAPKTCSATFSVTTAPPVVLTCPVNQVEPPCQSEIVIETKFNTWLATASFTGGCSAVMTNNNAGDFPACGGSKTVTFTVTSSCEAPKTCSATFTVGADTIKPTFTKPANITIYKSSDIPDTTTLVNYDFNSGTSYSSLCPALFAGITSDVDASSNSYKFTTGTSTGTLAYTTNAIGGKGLRVDTSNVTGHWQFNLAGDNLTKCTNFAVYIQAKKNGTGSADTLKFQHSLNGTTWTTFRTKALTVGTWIQDTATVPGIANPSNLYLRVTYSGGSNTNPRDLYIDNFEVRANVCCTFDASPNVTGDVTDEFDSCNPDIQATYCDSLIATPCEGSHLIYRTWTLQDSCGNLADDQIQEITISDTTRPTFDVPANITIYKGGAVADTHTLVNYNFNSGQSYSKLSPMLYFGVESKIDTSSNVFKIDTGTVTGPLAFTTNLVAGRSLRVDTSSNPGYWQFNIKGSTLPICSDYFVYTQAYKEDAESADTLHYEYSLDSIIWTKFNSYKLTLDTWAEDTAKIPFTQSVSKLYLRISYSGSIGGGIKPIYIDNFQLRAFINYDSCGFDASPEITGYPTNLQDNCDTIPSSTYVDKVLTGDCPDEMIIERSWVVSDDCNNSRTKKQIITAIDTAAPQITCPPNVTITCEGSTSPDSTGYADATDNCADTVTNITHSDVTVPGPCTGDYNINRTWTAVDSCGNVSTCVQVINVDPVPGPFLTCPNDTTIAACPTQGSVNAAFTAWLAQASSEGGCNPMLTNNNTGAPDACGGTKTVIFTVTSDCTAPVTCSKTFAVAAAIPVAITCASNTVEAACQTQGAINAKFTTWLATTTFTGGCNAMISNNAGAAPAACGGTVTVTFTVTSTCEANKTCSATFGVSVAPPIVLNCAANQTEAVCQTQAAIDGKFATWLATANFTGGCNGTISNNAGAAPSACGGTATVTFTVTSTCEAPKTCSAIFTVTTAPAVVLTCPTNQTEVSCQTQAAIDSKFANWLGNASFSGGCNASVSNNSGAAPSACGGTATVTFTVTSSCEAPKTCSATFTVTTAPIVVLTCPTNQTEASCQTQADINNKFATWLGNASFSGGCNASISNNNAGAPLTCGGTTTVTFTVTSSCEPPKTCTATFGVTTAPPVVLTCPTNQTEAACQTQAAINAKFATWLTNVSFSGGCNASISNNNAGAPLACGGTASVTFTVTSSCEVPKTCLATFTVTTATPVALICPTNQTEATCQTQTAIDTKFATWLSSAVFAGGCNAAISNNNTGAPLACGGTVTVTFTVTSSCEPNKTCSATFGVTNAPPVVLTCATNQTEADCQTQGTINTKFATWLATASFTGGCNAMISNNSGAAPNACGGTVTVTFTVTSTCEPNKTCSATFGVTNAPLVVLTCAINQTEAACQTQAAINAKFTSWLATATFTGGCNAMISNNAGAAPLACGGTVTVTFTVTSTCEANKTCSATFGVTTAPAVVLNCAANQTEAACQTQAAIDAKYAIWLASATFSGGCNAMISNNGGTAPLACGGTKTVTFTVTSTCEANKTCSAIFSVTNASPVVFNCPINQTEASCQTQAAIDAKFAIWLATASFSGGCNGILTNSNTGAPSACGGSVAVIFAVMSDCEPLVFCIATFTVTTAPAVVLNCPVNQTEIACQTQATINTKFATWLANASFSGGCNATISNDNAGAPLACGGTTTVTFTVTSSCEPPKTCSATFAVTTAPPVVLTCPTNQIEAPCQTQAAINTKFATWLTNVSFSGGCNASISNNNTGAPLACGGTTTVTFTVTSTCEVPKTCSATFSVTAAPPVVLNCPGNLNTTACQTQADINILFNAWLSLATVSGGCNTAISNNNTGAPLACGGTVTVTFTVTSTCEAPVTCSSTFGVDNAPPVVLTCATNQSEATCQTQAAIDAKFATWIATASTSGGCNAMISNNAGAAPSACGGTVTVTFTVTSSCEPNKTCSATFGVTTATPVTLTCAVNQTELACQTQGAIDAKFATWLATATFTGGCNAMISNNAGAAPNACGGTVTVTFTVTSTCDVNKTCSAIFAVVTAPVVVLTCPANQSELACQTQAAIDAKFAIWLATASFSGGCNATISNNSGAAPSACGGTVTITFTVTSTCEAPKTCSATFAVATAPLVVLN
ncbi:MAG: hypothetical protein WAS55_05835, partial [Saprospiraceae bacterium]